MNVRLPVLVVDQDCELLTGLLEDMTAATSEATRRSEEEQRIRNGDVKRQQDRGDRRRKRQDTEVREAERRQREKERRQRDRDRAKAMKGSEMTTVASRGANDLDCGEEMMVPNEYGPSGGGGEMVAASGDGYQSRMRLVPRRVPMDGNSPGEGGDDVTGYQRKHGSLAGSEGKYNGGFNGGGVYDTAQADPVFAARRVAAAG